MNKVPAGNPSTEEAGDAKDGNRMAELRILLVAPNGRDSERVKNALSDLEVSPVVCDDSYSLLECLKEGAGTAIIVQEALSPATLSMIGDWLNRQPQWSDFPFIVLGCGGNPNPAVVKNTHDIERLGNVTLLERPLRAETLRSCARVALRARQRQYGARRDLENLSLAIRDLEQFAYSASHDLREPLRTVAIYSELLGERYRAVLDDAGHMFLSYLRSAAGRMEMLVRDLLAYTQATGFDEEAPEPVAADEHLAGALESLHEAIDRSRAVITFDRLPSVRVKPGHLRQVFQNLIANAIQYRDSNEARNGEHWTRIHVSAVRKHEKWRFSVSDNGIGIDPQFRERIFGIFKRLHTNEQFAGSGTGAGTGIGLAICQKIVERYRGRIWVESSLGEGSTFYFTLPAG
ncbi:MAG: ATP-binding protein [Acidobacteriota bacterium]|nr:ATP-binding protein [Acidobacteriota bacterium]